MRKIVSILLCILWMGFIFYNSSQSGSNSNNFTNKIVDKLITISERVEEKDTKDIKVYATPQKEEDVSFSASSLINGVKSKNKGVLNTELRKMAHAFEFLILAVLLCNVFFTWGFKGKNVLIYILFITLFYAVTDEFHQIYVIGRGSSVKDVLIDFVGGIIGIILYYICYYSIGKIKKKVR